MKRVFVVIVCLAVLLSLAACGGSKSSSSTSTQPQTSGIKKRVFVTNEFRSDIQIVDAATDTIKTVPSVDSTGNTVLTPVNQINAGTSPTLMALSPDKKITMVFGTTFNAVTVLTNATESAVGQIVLPAFSESMVVGADNKTGFAAVRNAPVTGQPSGAVEVLDLSGFAISATIAVPAVHRIVLSHNGAKLLAFSDGSDQVSVIDTASKTVTAVVTGFDRPVFGVFSSDDATAYIMSCGPECGGVKAKVNALTLSSNAVGPDVPVSAATVGLLDGSSLYVAGTAAGAGRLDVVNTGNMTVSKSAVAISDGFHYLMALASNGKLFVGARTCSNTSNGCLSIYNTAAGTAILSAPVGDVTGLQPIDGRNVVYVVEGGELQIYDTGTDKPQSTQLDVVGRAFDVKLVD